MKLSIVTTLYYSAPYVLEFYFRVKEVAQKFTEDYEIIFVNDGSPDDALEKAVSLHQQDEKVHVLDLSRNFGHHKAIMTGLAHARGEKVFLIDCDLEEAPELFEEFEQKMIQTNSDVVYGIQDVRK